MAACRKPSGSQSVTMRTQDGDAKMTLKILCKNQNTSRTATATSISTKAVIASGPASRDADQCRIGGEDGHRNQDRRQAIAERQEPFLDFGILPEPVKQRQQGEVRRERYGRRCDDSIGKSWKRPESATRKPGLGSIEHVPVHLREPDEKPEEWQARCKRRFQVPDIEDAAVEMNVRVIGIDGVDAARNLDMIPGIEKGAEKGDGSKPGDPAAIIRIFDDAEINLLHLRHAANR